MPFFNPFSAGLAPPPWSTPPFASSTPPLWGSSAPFPGAPSGGPSRRPPWLERIFGGDRGIALGQMAAQVAQAPDLHTALATLGQVPGITRALGEHREEREGREEDRLFRRRVETQEQERRDRAEDRAAEMQRVNIELSRLREKGLLDEQTMRKMEIFTRAQDPEFMSPSERTQLERMKTLIEGSEQQKRESAARTQRIKKETELLGAERPKLTGVDPVALRQGLNDLRDEASYWRKQEFEVRQKVIELEGPDESAWSEYSKGLLDDARNYRERSQTAYEDAQKTAMRALAPTREERREPPAEPSPLFARPENPVATLKSHLEGAQAPPLADELVGKGLRPADAAEISTQLDELSPVDRQRFLERLREAKTPDQLADVLEDFF